MLKETLKRIGIGLAYIVPITLAGGAVVYVVGFLGPASLLIAALLFIAWMVGDIVESSKEHKKFIRDWKEESDGGE